MMIEKLIFRLKTICFDEDYHPSDGTRITTNFANLARGPHRQENLRNTLRMIDGRFNELAEWDNPTRDRYSVGLEIVSVELSLSARDGEGSFPLIEMLNTSVFDHRENKRIPGIVGNNFSSYVRDYDFSILLPSFNAERSEFRIPENFGDLHGKFFQRFTDSTTYKQAFSKPPVICISVSSSKIYQRTVNWHPVMGIEYQQTEPSTTDHYFAKMGMQVRFFMPKNSAAPLAFYFYGDLLGDYTNLELISTISTMETFQKIYRPEIYNANSAAGYLYQPNLQYQDYSSTQVIYDREERAQLAISQGKFARDHFIEPYKSALEHLAFAAVS